VGAVMLVCMCVVCVGGFVSLGALHYAVASLLLP
jgi:hypothetical protein